MPVMSDSMFDSLSWTSWNAAIGRPNCSRRWAYATAHSYAPMACPSPSQAMDCRLLANTRLVSEKEREPASRLPSGTRTPSRRMSACQTPRLLDLPVMTVAS